MFLRKSAYAAVLALIGLSVVAGIGCQTKEEATQPAPSVAPAPTVPNGKAAVSATEPVAAVSQEAAAPK